MKRNLFVPMIMLMILTIACDRQPTTTESDPDTLFLTGRWVMPGVGEEADKIFIEEWTAVNDTFYSGNAYVENIASGDRFNSEQLRLTFRNGTWIYTAEPAGHPSIDFTCTTLKEDHLVFENPEHDFPQYIKYRKITEDSLTIFIGDTTKTHNWSLVRIP